MKNLLFIFVSIVLFASCSSSKTFHGGAFQKRKYTKGFYFHKKQDLPIIQSKLKIVKRAIKIETEAPFYDATIADTVKITLKNGKIYNGVIKEDTEEGVLLQLKNMRTIYLLKSDIVESISLDKKNGYERPKTRKKNSNEQEIELTILLKNGEELQGTVRLASSKEYKVLTSSGKRIYVRKQKVKNIYKPNEKATLHPASKLSFVFFILGVFSAPFGIGLLLLLIGAPLGILGFKATEKSPGKYNYLKAKRLKNVYIVFWAVILSLTLILLLSFFL